MTFRDEYGGKRRGELTDKRFHTKVQPVTENRSLAFNRRTSFTAIAYAIPRILIRLNRMLLLSSDNVKLV